MLRMVLMFMLRASIKAMLTVRFWLMLNLMLRPTTTSCCCCCCSVSADICVSCVLQEQELYQREGLGVNEVHYVDNQDCIGTRPPLMLFALRQEVLVTDCCFCAPFSPQTWWRPSWWASWTSWTRRTACLSPAISTSPTPCTASTRTTFGLR